MSHADDFGHNHIGPHFNLPQARGFNYIKQTMFIRYEYVEGIKVQRTFLSYTPFDGNNKPKKSLLSILEYTASYFEQKEKTRLRHGKEWKEKANAFKLGKVCCKCGSDKLLAVHHISNEDYYDLTEKNCIVICKGCHYKIHHPLSK
jgi:hypothetical protein